MPRPLDGLVVVELSGGVAAALAGRMLAGYGAEVIKVEPPEGDPLRTAGPFPPNESGAESSAAFLYFNGGKSSVVLDLETAAARSALRELLRDADLLLTDTPAAELRQANPRLSVISITPYGESGPHAGYLATALTEFAAGGQMSLMGEPDREPLASYGNQAECQAAFHVFCAAMASQLLAARTGQGQYVELSTQEIQASAMEAQGPMAWNGDGSWGRGGNSMRAIWSQYVCKDGYVGVFVNAPNLPAFFRAIDRPELLERAAEPDFLAGGELREIVTGWCAARTRDEVYRVGLEVGAPFSFVATPEDLLGSEVVAKTGIWREVSHPVAGELRVPGPPFRTPDEAFVIDRAPLLGEHTADVLTRRAGLSPEEAGLVVGAARRSAAPNRAAGAAS